MQPVSPPPADPAILNPTAVTGRRILAFLIDAAIGTAIVFGYAAATFTNTEFESDFTAELQCDVINELTNDVCVQAGSVVYVGTGGDAAVIALLWFLWVLFSTMILPGITGWSPGKLATGIRVAKAGTLEKAGLGANIIRGILWIVDAFPYFGPLVGGVTMLASGDNRRVGDFAAGTVVVRAASLGRPPVQVAAPTMAPPPGAFTPPPPAPTAGVAPAPPVSASPPPPSAAPAPPTSAVAPPPPGGAPAFPAPDGAPPVSSSPPPPPPGSAPYALGGPGAAAPPPTGPPASFQPPPPAEYQAPSPASGAPPVFPPPTAPPSPEPEPGPEPTTELAAADLPVTESVPVVEPAVSEPEPAAPEPIAESVVEAQPIAEPEVIQEPEPAVTAPEPAPAPEPSPTTPPTEAPPRPGVDAPMWDEARDTYIQWDPELTEWMMWSEATGRWVPISR